MTFERTLFHIGQILAHHPQLTPVVVIDGEKVTTREAAIARFNDVTHGIDLLNTTGRIAYGGEIKIQVGIFDQ